MNVAVLGAGGGGLAVAYEWASQGHRVSLYAQRTHDHHLAPVRERGGIQAEGVLEGFVPLQTVTSDIAEALDGVEVVFVVGPAYATVRIYHRFDTGFWAAAAPRGNTPRLLAVLRQVYRNTEEAAGIFQTTLQNGNPVIHPAVTLLNAALIERTGGDFMFYEEGVTEAVGHLMKAVDD